MSAPQAPTYVRIESAQDRAQLLTELQNKAVVLAGLTEDHHQFLFRVSEVRSESVRAEILPPAGRSLRVGEPLQILFGLADGLFLARTKVLSASYDEVVFPFGEDVHRLQRRDNFRTQVPAEARLSFRLASLRTSTAPRGALITPLDISAGGMRLKWPAAKLERPAVGDQLSGALLLASGKQIELFAVVKTVMVADASFFHVGVEFQNLSVRDEQTLMFACVQFAESYR